MRKRTTPNTVSIFATALLAISIGFVTLPSSADSQEAKKPTYAELVEKAKSGDPTVDFAALRYAFLEAPGGHKEGFFNSREFNTLFQQKDYEKVLQTANNYLAQDFVDIRSHFFAGAALHALGREPESQKESALAKGLVKSITDSGDGKSQKTAYVVISTSEEYALLEWQGIHATSQSLQLGKDGAAWDVLAGTRGSEAMNVYFDISKFYGKELRKN
jgi:Domain of unknown function (DUF4919)